MKCLWRSGSVNSKHLTIPKIDFMKCIVENLVERKWSQLFSGSLFYKMVKIIFAMVLMILSIDSFTIVVSYETFDF